MFEEFVPTSQLQIESPLRSQRLERGIYAGVELIKFVLKPYTNGKPAALLPDYFAAHEVLGSNSPRSHSHPPTIRCGISRSVEIYFQEAVENWSSCWSTCPSHNGSSSVCNTSQLQWSRLKQETQQKPHTHTHTLFLTLISVNIIQIFSIPKKSACGRVVQDVAFRLQSAYAGESSNLSMHNIFFSIFLLRFI